MYTYPHTIENGAGESLTFLRRVADPGGDYLEVENCVGPGSGPPMHVHFHQEEGLTVVEGRIGYQVLGEEPRFAVAGEKVVFKPGCAHKFWNAGDGMLRCKGYIKPPDSIEYFLTQIYQSTKENGGKVPKPIDAAFLLDRYRSEFDMLEIPGFVKKVIMPVMLRLGKLTGKLEKFADAPEPVKR